MAVFLLSFLPLSTFTLDASLVVASLKSSTQINGFGLMHYRVIAVSEFMGYIDSSSEEGMRISTVIGLFGCMIIGTFTAAAYNAYRGNLVAAHRILRGVSVGAGLLYLGNLLSGGGLVWILAILGIEAEAGRVLSKMDPGIGAGTILGLILCIAVFVWSRRTRPATTSA